MHPFVMLTFRQNEITSGWAGQHGEQFVPWVKGDAPRGGHGEANFSHCPAGCLCPCPLSSLCGHKNTQSAQAPLPTILVDVDVEKQYGNDQILNDLPC